MGLRQIIYTARARRAPPESVGKRGGKFPLSTARGGVVVRELRTTTHPVDRQGQTELTI